MANHVSLARVPKFNKLDALSIVAAGLGEAIGTLFRRLVGIRRRKDWGIQLELMVAVYRGVWSLLPKLGILRWRVVCEALSPLRTTGLEIKPVQWQGAAGPLSGAWLDAPDAGAGVILYLHGGGFVFGSLRTHGSLIGSLARAARARVFTPEYRLAPDHAAPAAQEDAIAAYRDLLSQGVPAKCIVLAGDSAGATLVLGTLLALRDAKEPLPAAGVLISPWVDLSGSGASFQDNSAFDYLSTEACQHAAACYLNGMDPRQSGVSPLFADLTGLPPLLVQLGTAEVLRDQAREFVRRARAADVSVECSEYADMVHVWPLLLTPQARLATEEVGAYVRRRLGLEDVQSVRQPQLTFTESITEPEP